MNVSGKKPFAPNKRRELNAKSMSGTLVIQQGARMKSIVRAARKQFGPRHEVRGWINVVKRRALCRKKQVESERTEEAVLLFRGKPIVQVIKCVFSE